MADRICICGVLLQPSPGRPRKYCSKNCRNKAVYRTAPKDDSERCTAEGCTRRRSTKYLCLAHYSAVQRRTKTITIVCANCGKEASVQPRSGRDNKYCSLKCGSQAYNDSKRSSTTPRTPKAKPQLKQCEWCLQLHQGRTKFCSDACSDEKKQSTAQFMAKQQQQMMFRRSFENGDYVTFFNELRDRVDIDRNGCWIWAKRLKSGYPIVKWGKTQAQVHRLSLEAKHGKPLGTQAAHHICAVPACVNPDHLQPVTHRDNLAEMMQRRAYLDRIEELTNALAAVDPDNPALNRIEVA